MLRVVAHFALDEVRYALGAVTDVLRDAAATFEQATTGGRRFPMLKVQLPKAPRRRGTGSAGTTRPVSD